MEDNQDYAGVPDHTYTTVNGDMKNDPTSIPDYNDELLWCEECGRAKHGECAKHGGYNKVRDRSIPTRARLTVPHYLAIRTLDYRCSGRHVCGVFAKKGIQNRSQFGPFEANVVDTFTGGTENFMLKLLSHHHSSCFLDSMDEHSCNWMMFVRPALNAGEQNLIAYQYRGHIFYTSIKNIFPNEELKVWYAAHYAKALNKPLLPAVMEQETTTEDSLKDEDTATKTALNEEDVTGGEDEYEEDNFFVDVDLTCGAEEVNNTTQDLGDRGGEEEVEQNVMSGAPEKDLFCPDCGRTFKSFSLWEEHSCSTTKSGKKLEGRRTRNKRKGRPIKLDERESDPRQSGGDMNRGLGAGSDKQADQDGGAADHKTNSNLRRSKRQTKKKALIHKTAAKIKAKARAKAKSKGKAKGRGQSRTKKKSGPTVPKKIHMCAVCNMMFHSETKLVAHTYIHTGIKPFRCEDQNCHKSFTSKFKLDRHMLIHSGAKKFTCSYCLKSFTRKDHLKNHVKVHDPNKVKLTCERCGREYCSKAAHRMHMAFHQAEDGSLTCGVCSQGFEAREDLIYHLKVHTGARSVKGIMEKKYVCKFCDKRFFTSKDVSRHMVVHTKDRNYLCQHCPQRFGRKDHLVRHLKQVHAGKPDSIPNPVPCRIIPSSINAAEKREEVQPVSQLLKKLREQRGETTSQVMGTSDPAPGTGGFIQDLSPIQLQMPNIVNILNTGNIPTAIQNVPVTQQVISIAAAPPAPASSTANSSPLDSEQRQHDMGGSSGYFIPPSLALSAPISMPPHSMQPGDPNIGCPTNLLMDLGQPGGIAKLLESTSGRALPSQMSKVSLLSPALHDHAHYISTGAKDQGNARAAGDASANDLLLLYGSSGTLLNYNNDNAMEATPTTVGVDMPSDMAEGGHYETLD